MFETIKNFFRKHRLNKVASKTPTGLLPLSKITSATFLVDAAEPEFEKLKEDILTWCRQNNISGNLYFLDLRKLNKDELVLTSIQTTILKKELDWLGYPDTPTIRGLIEEPCDLFISMVNEYCPAVDYTSKCANARFKIGRTDYPGHVYDMVFSGSQNEDLRSDSRLIFKAMTDFISKIEQ